MKEWLKNMAKALNLPESTPEAEILAKASEHVLAGGAAKVKLSSVAEQLAAAGFKLDGEKVVKLDPVTPKVDDSPEVKDLKARVALQELESTKSKLSAAKTEVDSFLARGILPPAVKEPLSRIFASTGKLESLALSQDGQAIVRGTVDVLADLRAVLNAIPATSGTALARMRTANGAETPEAERLAQKGRGVAARVAGKKPEKTTA
jgi:hypothetical protein